MKKINIAAILSLLLIYSCVGSEDYSDLFNYNITRLNDDIKEKHLVGEEVVLKDDSILTYYEPLIYDSLLISYQALNGLNYFYKIHNLNNKSLVGNFCVKGRARDEFLVITPFRQLKLNDNGELLGYVHDVSARKTSIWNITKSISQNRTVVDSVILGQGTKPASSYLFYLPNQKYLAHTVTHDIYSIPKFELRSVCDNAKENEYKLYNRNIKEGEVPQLAFDTEDCIKPDDNSKIAMIMRYFPHIAILDVKTGKVKGYSVGESNMYDPNDLKSTFVSIDVTDKYIYALFRRTDAYPFKENLREKSILYKLNWNGELIDKYIFDKEPIVTIVVDRSSTNSDVIYGVSSALEKIYKYIGVE